MKTSEVFPNTSEWLKVDDIPDEGLTATIDSYDVQDFKNDGKTQRKPVLYFKEDVKALVLNKTNAGSITTIVGSDELDDWIGTKITMVPREVEFAGKQVWAIRIQMPRRQSNRAAAAAQAPSRGRAAAAELDQSAPNADDIPF